MNKQSEMPPPWVIAGESVLIRPYNTSGVISFVGPTHFQVRPNFECRFESNYEYFRAESGSESSSMRQQERTTEPSKEFIISQVDRSMAFSFALTSWFRINEAEEWDPSKLQKLLSQDVRNFIFQVRKDNSTFAYDYSRWIADSIKKPRRGIEFSWGPTEMIVPQMFASHSSAECQPTVTKCEAKHIKEIENFSSTRTF